MDYKESGVDVEKGESLVQWLSQESKLAKSSPALVEGIGGFASLFRFPKNDYEKPCLVSCTDGVGTKLKLAFEFAEYEGIGQDLVAMCVNDLVTVGARPLFFLDYFSTGELDLEIAKPFLKGVRNACENSDCLLIGGETAEMPGFYPKGEFDCAGFSVGVVDEDRAWGKDKVQKGDVLFGVSSSGFHSNGYSLLRRLFETDKEKYKDSLLEPTALYVKPVLELIARKSEVHAAVHVTGGGIDNISRVIPSGLTASVNEWLFKPIFSEALKRSKATPESIMQTFNCGVGFILIAPKESKESIESAFSDYEIKEIGRIETGEKRLHVEPSVFQKFSDLAGDL